MVNQRNVHGPQRSIFQDDISEKPEVVFEITVPFEEELDELYRVPVTGRHKTFLYFSKKLNFENCEYSTHNLEHGATYEISLHKIRRSIYGQRCYSFSFQKKSLYVGAKGLYTIWKYGKKYFPIESKVAIFDKIISLPMDGIEGLVPLIYTEKTEKKTFYDFVTEEFKCRFHKETYIMIVKKIS